MCSTLNEQKLVLNGQKSTWENANASVPQGSILGHIFVLNLYK